LPARRLSRHQKGWAAGAFPGATHWRPGCADTTSGGWVGLFLERPTSRQVALALSGAAQGNPHQPPMCTERRTELLEAVLWPDAALLCWGICRCRSTLAASVALQAGIPTRPPLSLPEHRSRRCRLRETAPPTRPSKGKPSCRFMQQTLSVSARTPPTRPSKGKPSRRAGGWERDAAGHRTCGRSALAAVAGAGEASAPTPLPKESLLLSVVDRGSTRH